MRSWVFILLVCAAGLPAATPARDAARSQAEAAMARLPLNFESNQGQLNPAVRFAAHAQPYNVLLTETGASLAFRGGKRVDLRLEGANPAPEIQPSGKMALETSYFLGARQNWRTGVPNYARVIYRDSYPGIDVAYYGADRRLEYDFVVAPGADPAAIRMRFEGAERTSIDTEGDLLMECGGGQLVEKRPYVYQEGAARHAVEGRYVRLADGAIGLRVGEYDHAKPLVIDP